MIYITIFRIYLISNIYRCICFFCCFTEDVLNNVKNCPRSKALFYDQLSCIVLQTQIIDAEFMSNLTNYIEEEFVSTNMIEKTSYKYKTFCNQLI